MTDAQGWIETEDSEVQTVMTIKIDRTTPKITIHKWEEAPYTRRMTRSGSLYHRTTKKRQEVVVELLNGTISVTGSLDIQFEKYSTVRKTEANVPNLRRRTPLLQTKNLRTWPNSHGTRKGSFESGICRYDSRDESIQYALASSTKL